MTENAEDKYPPKEAERRFKRAIQGALKTPPKPYSEIRGKRKKKPASSKSEVGSRKSKDGGS